MPSSEIADNPAKINQNNVKSKSSNATKTTELKTGAPSREVIILKFKLKIVAMNSSKHDNVPSNNAISSKHNDNVPSSSAISSGKIKNVVRVNRVNVNPGKVVRFRIIKDSVNKPNKDGSRKFAVNKTGRIQNAAGRNKSTVKRLKKAAVSSKLINARPKIGKANVNVRKRLEIVSEPTKPDVITGAIIGIIGAITGIMEITAIIETTEIASNTTAINRNVSNKIVGRNIIKEINGGKIVTPNAKDSFRENEEMHIIAGSRDITSVCVRIVCGCKERGIMTI